MVAEKMRESQARKGRAPVYFVFPEGRSMPWRAWASSTR